MPSLLTTDQVRGHVETDLSDVSLQLLVDANDAEITRRLGVLGTQTEVLEGGNRYIYPARAISAVVSCVERYSLNNIGIIDVPINLDPTKPDIKLYDDGRRIERLFNGAIPASRFLGVVTIVFTPLDTTLERQLLLIKLVKLDLQYTGLEAESVGDTRTQYLKDHVAQRDILYRSLQTAGRRILS